MLSKEQIEAIEKEAKEKYPYPENLTTGLNIGTDMKRQYYIAGKTSGIEEAEVIAISFAEWKDKKTFKQIGGLGIYGYLERIFTTKELFSLFIKQYLKK